MPEAGTADPRDKLVLVVDDDEDLQEFLRFALKAEGFRIEQAFDGREALRKIRGLMPDLILLDMMFPRHGGQDILAMLQQGPTASIPVIAMTGCFKDGLTKASLSLEPNVAEFFEKPIDTERLIAKVHQLLNTRRGVERNR